MAKTSNSKLIIDTSGEPKALEAGVYMIKPNWGIGKISWRRTLEMEEVRAAKK
jgi:fructose-1-phosphate kinase PfkB-like protein